MLRNLKLLLNRCLLLSSMVFQATTVFAFEYQSMKFEDVQFEVIKVDDLKDLQLFLKNPRTGDFYQKFSNIQSDLAACKELRFAMNAGMYHPNFEPVGLYIEKKKKLSELNESTGFGNFFMQPNGVVAWNDHGAVIHSTADYKRANFTANFATQSGPMLVHKGLINSQFIKDSNSLKIRNGVGLRDDHLYFVISEQRINFYQFAKFFKQQLRVDEALYLDGSISSLYLKDIQRNDRKYNLGPIVGLTHQMNCKL
ncbi:hypothetical protein HGO21_43755 [Acinetobacter sp. CUI P1]|nr:hypothetical protein [Acinetobacter sp. CUI P1]